MMLAQFQEQFIACLLDDARPLAPGWDARFGEGLEIYRNAYRARLVDALAETFPRTRQWLGEEMFAAAAAHHLIVHPPRQWTLDLAGDGLAETLTGLFPGDGEVPELAWLEWAMHCAYCARDSQPLDAAGFAAATAHFGEADWAGLRLGFTDALHIGEMAFDCPALWQALRREDPPEAAARLPEAMACLVWREELTPVFVLVSQAEADGLRAMHQGGSFGALCESLAASMPPAEAAGLAGGMLAHWLGLGLVAAVSAGSGPGEP